MKPQAVHIEVVEKSDLKLDPDSPGNGIIAPREVRLNGVPLLGSAQDPVIVHEVSTLGNEPVKVTLTLFAHLVEYKREPKDGAA